LLNLYYMPLFENQITFQTLQPLYSLPLPWTSICKISSSPVSLCIKII
jgi:hypothetical protein